MKRLELREHERPGQAWIFIWAHHHSADAVCVDVSVYQPWAIADAVAEIAVDTVAAHSLDICGALVMPGVLPVLRSVHTDEMSPESFGWDNATHRRGRLSALAHDLAGSFCQIRHGATINEMHERYVDALSAA